MSGNRSSAAQAQPPAHLGAKLREARERAGLTQEQLGQRIDCSRHAVGRLEDMADPRLSLRQLLRISDVLDMPVAALLGPLTDGEDPVNRRQLLQATTAGMVLAATSRPAPGMVGGSEIAELEQGISNVRLLDQRTGGDPLRYFAHRLVADAEYLMSGRLTSGLATKLQSVYGEACVLAGWLAQDAGELQSAGRYYSDATTAAQLANDPWLTAHACANMSMLATRAAQPTRAIQCAQAGHRAAIQARGGPRLRALLAAREARAHAAVGDAAATADLSLKAQRALDSAHGVDPAWVAFVTPTELAGILGDAQCEVGNHAQAITHLTTAAQMGDRARNATSWRLALALGYASAGDPGQAAAIGLAALPEVNQLSSGRLRGDVVRLAECLHEHSKVPEVRDFHSHAAEAGLA